MNTLIKDRTNFIYTFLHAPRETSSRCDAKNRSCTLEWPLLASPMLYRPSVPRAMPGASYFAPSGLESVSSRTSSAGGRTSSEIRKDIDRSLNLESEILNPPVGGQVLESARRRTNSFYLFPLSFILYPCSPLHLSYF